MFFLDHLNAFIFKYCWVIAMAWLLLWIENKVLFSSCGCEKRHYLELLSNQGFSNFLGHVLLQKETQYKWAHGIDSSVITLSEIFCRGRGEWGILQHALRKGDILLWLFDFLCYRKWNVSDKWKVLQFECWWKEFKSDTSLR